MSAAWVIEAVDILEDGGFGLAMRFPIPEPDEFCLDRLEEGLKSCVVVAIAGARGSMRGGLQKYDTEFSDRSGTAGGLSGHHRNLVLSRIRSAPSARLGHLSFEGHGAFPAQG